jgi:hypothetical protein
MAQLEKKPQMIPRCSNLPTMPALPSGLRLQPVTVTHLAALKELRSPLLFLVKSQKEIWSRKDLDWYEKSEELWLYTREILIYQSATKRFCFSVHLFFVSESALRQMLASGATALRKAARAFREQFATDFHTISEAALLHLCRAISPRLDGSGGFK